MKTLKYLYQLIYVIGNVQKQNLNFSRSPRLATVIMVEAYVQEHSGEFKIYQLWKRLPKKVMYQTYKIILSYLIEINKIAVDAEGEIGYIWDSEYAREKNLQWR